MTGKEGKEGYGSFLPDKPLEGMQTLGFQGISPDLIRYVLGGMRGEATPMKAKGVSDTIASLGKEAGMLNVPPEQRKEIERMLMESLTKPDSSVLKYALSPLGIGFRPGRETTENISYPGAIDYLGSGMSLGGSIGGMFSDIRLKENIEETEKGTEALKKIDVIDFNFIGEDNKQQGFSAQQIKEIYPEAVVRGIYPMMIDYGRLTPLLVKTIQELTEKVEQLEKRLEEK